MYVFHKLAPENQHVLSTYTHLEFTSDFLTHCCLYILCRLIFKLKSNSKLNILWTNLKQEHFSEQIVSDWTLSASLQLHCDKTKITAHIGGEFLLICQYDTNGFLFSKKYWCRGDSRSTCEILVDSEGVAKTEKTHKSHILDARRRGLFVKVTDLQFDDAGVYWVGIDKIYADIMTSVNVIITEGKNKTETF